MVFFFISWVLFFFLLAFINFFFFGKNFGVQGSWWISFLGNLMVFFSVMNLFSFFHPDLGNISFFVNYGNWINFNSFFVDFSFSIDGHSLVMTQLVAIVSFVTQIYSYYYLENEANIEKFQSYLCLFTFFMIVLVNSDNLVLFFMGWEGVGLCSYLLVGFWNNSPNATIAALKAVSINRFGDTMFIIAMCITILNFGTTDFSSMALLLPYMKQNLINFPMIQKPVSLIEMNCFFFALAALVKSAQFGFHGWLADAMEGPTPVSALIHAATMVTAGIYLVLKLNFFFYEATYASQMLAFMGAVTAFFGASVAFFQWDIKKIIAYSTCSQLGYMFCSAGLGGVNQAFFHLVSHGYFKALLFFSSGLLIHSYAGEQDIRKMGKAFYFMPTTASFFFIGLSSLTGLPGTSGFFSKESIFDVTLASPHTNYFSNFCTFMLAAALFFTVMYSMKIIWWVFFKPFNSSKPIAKNLTVLYSETSNATFILMQILSFMAVFGSSMLQAYLSEFQGIAMSPASIVFFEQSSSLKELLATPGRYIPNLTFIFACFIFAYLYILPSFIFNFNMPMARKMKVFFSKRKWSFFFQKGWFFDTFLMQTFFYFFSKMIYQFFRFERTIGDFFIPTSVERMTWAVSKKISFYSFFYSFNRIFFSFSFILILMFFFILQKMYFMNFFS